MTVLRSTSPNYNSKLSHNHQERRTRYPKNNPFYIGNLSEIQCFPLQPQKERENGGATHSWVFIPEEAAQKYWRKVEEVGQTTDWGRNWGQNG